MFIRTKRDGEFISSDAIVRVRRGVPREIGYGPNAKHKVETILADLRDGTVTELAGVNSDEVVAKLAPIIPAAPGYEALWSVEYEDGTIEVMRHPVLGWRLGLYGELTPVTIYDEVSSNVTFGGVKYPDGRVGDCDWYTTEEEWIEEVRQNSRKVA